ncbi:MAG: hypothetical protein V4555_15885, partial [Acidobacteriota bacterium]
MHIRRVVRVVALLAVLPVTGWLPRAVAQDPNVKVDGSLIEGPAEPAEFAKWLADMKRWRREQMVRIGYDGSEY